MKKMYVVGISRDARGAIVRWTQLVKNIEQAEEVACEWEATGIEQIQIINV